MPDAPQPAKDLLTNLTDAVRDVGAFWDRVSDGLAVQTLWAQFFSEAHASYSLYQREVDWEGLRYESRFHRLAKISRALFWAMLMKLSPARRVFLLFVFLLLICFAFNLQPAWIPREAEFLAGIGGLVFLLGLELADRVIMKRDLEIARDIQRWLVPQSPPQMAGVDIAFSSRPANTVGGDYYDAFPLDGAARGSASSRLLLVVADVAGKSVPAALLMATFQASLRTLAGPAVPLPELVGRMNEYACAHSLGGSRFTTAFFAEYDPATHVLTYIRAGHNPPVLRRGSGQLERLEEGDLPMGIKAGRQFASASITLGAGDLLVIFSDGVTEAVNAQDEEFGEPRLLAAVQSLPSEGAAALLARLSATLANFTGAARQHDDMTWLIVRVEH